MPELPNILSRRATEIDEAMLSALSAVGLPEGLELEYKAELHLGSRDQNRETAKDVSAMANTAGGRLLYGVSERALEDGTKVAGPVTPLLDGAVIEALGNIVATTIRPRPLVAIHRVEVGGGFVLVVDVRPSTTDVYMVSAYGENRYYKRGPTGVVPMSEPEVKQAYERAATTRGGLEARERELLGPEEARRSLPLADSFFVVPLLPTSMIDPAHVGEIKSDIETVLAAEPDIAQELALALKIEADGCRAGIPWGDAKPYLYFAALKTGVIHLSFDGALCTVVRGEKEPVDFSSGRFINRALQTLQLARRIHERAAYHGPVRVHYVLWAGVHFSIDRNPRGMYRNLPTAPGGPHRTGPVEAYLAERGYSRILKQLLDPLFHAVGQPAAPMFDANGAAREEVREGMPSLLADTLD